MLAAVQRHVGEGDPQSVGDPQGAKLVMDTVRVPVREVRKAGAVCEVLDVGIPCMWCVWGVGRAWWCGHVCCIV